MASLFSLVDLHSNQDSALEWMCPTALYLCNILIKWKCVCSSCFGHIYIVVCATRDHFLELWRQAPRLTPAPTLRRSPHHGAGFRHHSEHLIKSVFAGRLSCHHRMSPSPPSIASTHNWILLVRECLFSIVVLVSCM